MARSCNNIVTTCGITSIKHSPGGERQPISAAKLVDENMKVLYQIKILYFHFTIGLASGLVFDFMVPHPEGMVIWFQGTIPSL